MKGPVAFIALLLVLQSNAASAQQKQFYDSAGHNAGRAVTDGQGSTTYYGPDGRVTARSSTSGDTTTVYGADGRRTGTITAVVCTDKNLNAGGAAMKSAQDGA